MSEPTHDKDPLKKDKPHPGQGMPGRKGHLDQQDEPGTGGKPREQDKRPGSEPSTLPKKR